METLCGAACVVVLVAVQMQLLMVCAAAAVWAALGADRLVGLLALWLAWVWPRAPETSGGGPWPRFRDASFWTAARAFFDATVSFGTGAARAASGRPVIFFCFPHGALALASSFVYARDVFAPFSPTDDWRIAVAPAIFRLPLIREGTLWSGGVSATKASFRAAVSAGFSVCVYPGGAEEAMLNRGHEGTQRAVQLRISPRLLRLALELDVAVVPVYTLGELEALTPVLPLGAELTRGCAKRFKVAPILPVGRAPLLPRPAKMRTLVGAPVKACSEESLRAAVEEGVRALYAELAAGLPGRATAELVFSTE